MFISFVSKKKYLRKILTLNLLKNLNRYINQDEEKKIIIKPEFGYLKVIRWEIIIYPIIGR